MSDVRIAPSILSADFLRLGEELLRIREAGCEYLHFDVMDGSFVSEISYGEPVLRAIGDRFDLFKDIHLMVSHPERHIESFKNSGADGITFHLEAAEEPEHIIRMIHEAGMKAAVSIRPDTDIECLFPYLDSVDMVLVMTVQPGYGAQKLIESSYERIRRLKEEITERGLQLPIEVDGGVNFETGPLLRKAGADIFVSGSVIFRGDAVQNALRLRKAICGADEEETV